MLRVVYAGVSDFTAAASGRSVSFTDRSDVTGAATYRWDFGDGTTAHERNPTHTYAAPGTYRVSLVVTGLNGKAEVATKEVAVSAAAGVAPVSSADAKVGAAAAASDPPPAPARPRAAATGARRHC